jgi:ribosomal protein S18 acetylase RimI-like enzyme
MKSVEIRPMQQTDLHAVLEVVNTAFTGLIEGMYNRTPPSPLFASMMGTYRLALDPDGCHVAVADGEVVGANFSLLRGTLGWFGPLAVRPGFQGSGTAQRLVRESIASAERRGMRLMGLETLANSPQHVHLYQKLGFQPSWTGISYRRSVRGGEVPSGVQVDAPPPALDYVYPGFDASKDARATLSSKAGFTLTAGDGFAVCHVENTLWVEATTAYVPLIAAPDRPTFDALVLGVEALAGRHGRTAVATQVPGSSRATLDALLEHGYKNGGAALRMKRGEGIDYDSAPIYYCDDWH